METEKNPVQSADRIFQVMEVLAENRPMGLQELSDCVKLNKSTVHRLLNSLIYMGYARQDAVTGKYAITFKIVNIAGKILEKMDILSIARPYLEKLMENTQETVHLVRRDGIYVSYIDKIEPAMESHGVRMASYVGLKCPMYCTSVGKAIMAELSPQEVKEIWEKSVIEKKTEHTVTDFDDLSKELLKVKECGYATDTEENEVGVRCIGACIMDYEGKTDYAVSISSFVYRMDDARIGDLAKEILATTKDISLALGYGRM